MLGFASRINTGSENPANFIRVIGWVPADAVDSSKGAYDRLHNELLEAIQQTVDNLELEGRYTFGEPIPKDEQWDREWPISGYKCSLEGFECQYWYEYTPWQYVEGDMRKA